MDGFVLVHNKEILAFNFAQSAFGFNVRFTKILFRDGDFKFFGQIDEILVYLVRFHTITLQNQCYSLLFQLFDGNTDLFHPHWSLPP